MPKPQNFAVLAEQHAKQTLDLADAQAEAQTGLVSHLKSYTPLFDLFGDDDATFELLANNLLEQSRTLRAHQLQIERDREESERRIEELRDKSPAPGEVPDSTLES